MLKQFFLSITGIMLFTCLSAQEKGEFKPYGKVQGKIFTNFNSSLTGPEKRTGFEVQRAYFGYTHFISPELSAQLKLDIGEPNNDASLALLKRFAYFKTAAISYTKDNLKVSFGLLDTYQFKTQEKFWKRRYIARSFMDAYSFGPSADLGTNIKYTFGNYAVDLGFYNGEGYKKLQTDNSFMSAIGLSANPVKFLHLRVYGDLTAKTVKQATYGFFTGLRFEKFQIGGEYNYKVNNRFVEDQDRYGYSVYGHYNLTKKWELFARYDRVESNKLAGDDTPWNLASDGSAIWAGIQYTPIKNLNIALDYQDWYAMAKNGEDESAIYLNIQVAF